MNVEIIYKEDIYKELKSGKLKLVKEGALMKNLVDTEDIYIVSEKWTTRGTVDKNRCIIVHANLGKKVLEMPYEQIKHFKEFKPIVVKGFMK
jgi:hypothetical protein